MVPDKLINFKVYENGNDMIGIANITLPEISFMTDTIKGAGIPGEIDGPAVGHIQSMTITINWRTLIEENIKFAAPKTYHLEFMGSVQLYDEGSSEYKSKSISVVTKCVPKKFSLGKLDVATGMDTSGEYEVLYLKISINNKEYVEIDKLNFICKIDGVDYLSKIRADIGMN